VNLEHDNLLKQIDEYTVTFSRMISNIDYSQVIRILELFRIKMKSKTSFFVCGNGGSAALSQHFAIDLGLGTARSLLNNEGCKIYDLTANAAIITATANDLSYSEVFSSQLEFYAQSGDVLIAISASGNSTNILNAVNTAKQLGLQTVGLTGFDGGRLRTLVDFSIHVESEVGDYGRVEDAHSFLLHLLTNLLRKNYRI
jgi:D-sedoheptulose 7-phosphate isomerase